MKNKIVIAVLTPYQWRVFAILVLAMGWRMIFLLHRSFWEGLVPGSGNGVSTAWLVFLVSFYVSLAVACWLFRNRDFKIVLVVSLSASILLPLVLFAFPALQAGYVGYALFGLATGVYHLPIIYYGGFKYAQELRLPAIAMFMFGFYLMIDLAVFLLPILGFTAVLVIMSLLTAGGVVLGLGLEKLKLPEESGDGKKTAWSLRMVLTTGVGLCIAYFLNFLTESNMSGRVGLFQGQGFALAAALVQLGTCLVFIVLGLRMKIYHLIYVTLIVANLAYVGSAFGFGEYVPAYLLSRSCGVLLILSFYTLATAIVCRYPRKPLLLSLLVVCGAVGIILGNTTGTAIAAFLLTVPFLFYGLPVVILLVGIFLLPLYFRTLSEEVNLDGVQGVLPGAAHASPVARWQSLNRGFDDEFKLTEREIEIAGFLVERFDYETISGRLDISMNTLKTHVKSIYRKYNLRNRKDLILFFNRPSGTGRE